MRLLFDIGHPADVHLFKHTIWHFQKKGDSIQIVCRPRDNVIALLQRYGFSYQILGHYDSLWSKALGMLRTDYRMWKICQRFRPQVMVNFGSPYSSHIATLSKRPTVTLIDTEPKRFSIYYWQYRTLLQPFVKKVFMPIGYQQKFHTPRVIKYRGTKELAYLHPKYFKVNPGILEPLRLTGGEKIILIKFAAWDAIHDVNQAGFQNNSQRIEFVSALQKFGRVFISSEIDIPQLQPYYVNLAPGDIHHLLAVADLYVGEGATMASEAGILGVPWIFIYPHRLGYLAHQEKVYGLGCTVFSIPAALQKSIAYLSEPDIKKRWQEKRQRFLRGTTDVTKMIIDEIERLREMQRHSQ